MSKFFKGFDKDLKCRGFQYEVGKEYREADADLCHTGFHACENPLDVFKYYAPGAGSVYHEVELDEVTAQREPDDTKRCGKVIRVGAKLGIDGLCTAGVDFIRSNIDISKAPATNTGYCSAATNSGDYSAATNTGYCSAAEVSGNASVAMVSGKFGRVKGAVGCALFGAERGEWDGKTYPIVSVSAAIVDGDRIKADTWYTVKNGEFVEVSSGD